MLKASSIITNLWIGLTAMHGQAPPPRIVPEQPTVQIGSLARFEAQRLERPLQWSTESGGGWIAWNGEYKAPDKPGLYRLRVRDAKGREAEGFVNVAYLPSLRVAGTRFRRGQTAELAIHPFPRNATATVQVGSQEASHPSGGMSDPISVRLPQTPGEVEIRVAVVAFGGPPIELRASVTVVDGPSPWEATPRPVITNSNEESMETMLGVQPLIKPEYATAYPGDTVPFSLRDRRAGGWFASSGRVDPAGLWTAPPHEGFARLIAFGPDGTPFLNTANVNVTDVELHAVPAQAICGPGKKARFVALASRGPVCWEVVDAGGGTFLGDGVYQAPEAPGSYKVRARALWNPQRTVDLTVEVEQGAEDMPDSFTKPDPPPIPKAEGLRLSPSLLKLDAGTYASLSLEGAEERPKGALPLIRTAHCLTGAGDAKVDGSDVFTASTPGIYEIRVVDPDHPERFATALALVEPAIKAMKGIPRDLVDRELAGITSLATGEIFLTGGRNKERVPLATSYLYATTEEGIRPSVPLRGARWAPLLVALKGGQVLVLGGRGTWKDASGVLRQGALPFAEVLDPAARAAVPLPRPAPEALPGETPSLHLGGTLTALGDGTALACGGGAKEGEAAGPSYVFDPVSARFLKVEGPPLGAGHAATLLPDGRVFISGGFGENGRPTQRTWTFDPKTRRLQSGASMGLGRAWHGQSAFHDGKILVSGGVVEGEPFGEDGSGRPTASCETHVPGSTVFVKTAPMKRPRAGHASLYRWTGQIVVLGGWTKDAKGGPVSYPPEMESYSPDEGLWTVESTAAYGIQKPVMIMQPNGSIFTSGHPMEPTAKAR